MPIPVPRDRDEAKLALARWIEARQPFAEDVVVSDVGGPAYTGYSHETLMFDASWRDGEGRRQEHRLVARVKPLRHTVFPDDAFVAEHRVMSALGSTGVPLPRVLGREDDPSFLGSPFFLMERLEGEIPADNPPYTFGGWLLDSSPDDQAQLWWSGLDAMTAVHGVDHEKLDLSFLRAARTGEPGMLSELAYWRDYQRWVDGDLPPIERAFTRLEREFSDAEPSAPGLCWGDSRIGNQMFRDFTCVGVLDWEMATIADPEMDLAWFLYFDRVFSEGLGTARPPGFPSHAESVARWEGATGRTVGHLDAYLVFAGLRFSLVMLRLGQLLVGFEQLPPDSDFGTNNFAIQFLGRLLEETAR